MNNSTLSVRWGKYDAHAAQQKSVDRVHVEFPDDEVRLKQIFGDRLCVTIEAYPDHIVVMRDDTSRVRINRHVPAGDRPAFFVLDREGTSGQCHNLHRLPAFALADAQEVQVQPDSVLIRLPSELKKPRRMARGRKVNATKAPATVEQQSLPLEAKGTPTLAPKRSSDSAAARLAALRTTLNHAIRELRELGLPVQVTQAQAGGDVDMLIKF